MSFSLPAAGEPVLVTTGCVWVAICVWVVDDRVRVAIGRAEVVARRVGVVAGRVWVVAGRVGVVAGRVGAVAAATVCTAT